MNRTNTSNTDPSLLVKTGLVMGRIEKRYKRFLADVVLSDGSTVTAHCTNTGRMSSCWEPGDQVLLEPNDNPKRKLKFTWIASSRGGTWIGVETGVPNTVVAEAARRDVLPGLPGLTDVRTEVPYGREKSRIDVLATDSNQRRVYIEVKNSTLRVDRSEGPVACFPDAVTTRGSKHLRELRLMVSEGYRAAIVFFVHRADVAAFDVAADIDSGYAAELDRAAATGVEVLPLQADLGVRPQKGGLWSVAWTIRARLPWHRDGSRR